MGNYNFDVSVYIHVSLDVPYFTLVCRLIGTILRRPTRASWTSFIHPEGQPYYQARCEDVLYTTEVDITDDASYTRILRFILEIQERMKQKNLVRKSDIEVVLEIEKDREKSEEIWAFYVIDHQRKHPRWLEKCDVSDYPNRLPGGVPSIQHLST